jgi:hypothetical protein
LLGAGLGEADGKGVGVAVGNGIVEGAGVSALVTADGDAGAFVTGVQAKTEHNANAIARANRNTFLGFIKYIPPVLCF